MICLWIQALVGTVILWLVKGRSTVSWPPEARIDVKFLRRQRAFPATAIASKSRNPGCRRRRITFSACKISFPSWRNGWSLCEFSRRKHSSIWNWLEKSALWKLACGYIRWKNRAVCFGNRMIRFWWLKTITPKQKMRSTG